MNTESLNQLMRDRRTVKPKQFSDRKVDREIIEQMLENANWAPTHAMTQPWRFVVFQGDSRKPLGEFLSRTYQNIVAPDAFKPQKYEAFLVNPVKATAVIAIVMKRQATEKIPEIEEVEAVACAVQNMHLTAAAYGVGGFWSSNVAAVSDQMRDYLGYSQPDRCLGLFYVGHVDGDWPTSHRDSIADKVEWRS